MGDERRAVIIRLRTQRIQPVPAHIKEKGKGLEYEIKLPSIGAAVKAQDVVVFTRQFATMINAGLPIMQCLTILGAQTENKAFSKVIGQIRDDVESGSTLADATHRHPVVFTDLYTSLVQAGEWHPRPILVRLASYLEKAGQAKQGASSAPPHRGAAVAVLHPAHLGHPRLRRGLRELRIRAAQADAVRDGALGLRDRTDPLPDRDTDRGGVRPPLRLQDQRRPHGHRPLHAARAGLRRPAQGAVALHAPSRRSSPRASPFSTRSPSPRAPRATGWSNSPSSRRAAASRKARRSPSR
jgi:hypothetical protein